MSLGSGVDSGLTGKRVSLQKKFVGDGLAYFSGISMTKKKMFYDIDPIWQSYKTFSSSSYEAK